MDVMEKGRSRHQGAFLKLLPVQCSMDYKPQDAAQACITVTKTMVAEHEPTRSNSLWRIVSDGPQFVPNDNAAWSGRRFQDLAVLGYRGQPGAVRAHLLAPEEQTVAGCITGILHCTALHCTCVEYNNKT